LKTLQIFNIVPVDIASLDAITKVISNGGDNVQNRLFKQIVIEGKAYYRPTKAILDFRNQLYLDSPDSYKFKKYKFFLGELDPNTLTWKVSEVLEFNNYKTKVIISSLTLNDKENYKIGEIKEVFENTPLVFARIQKEKDDPEAPGIARIDINLQFKSEIPKILYNLFIDNVGAKLDSYTEWDKNILYSYFDRWILIQEKNPQDDEIFDPEFSGNVESEDWDDQKKMIVSLVEDTICYEKDPTKSAKIKLENINNLLNAERKKHTSTRIFVTKSEIKKETFRRITVQCGDTGLNFYLADEVEIEKEGGLGLKIINLDEFNFKFEIKVISEDSVEFNNDKSINEKSYTIYPNRYWKFDKKDFDQIYLDILDVFNPSLIEKSGFQSFKNFIPFYGRNDENLFLIVNFETKKSDYDIDDKGQIYGNEESEIQDTSYQRNHQKVSKIRLNFPDNTSLQLSSYCNFWIQKKLFEKPPEII
jgi:hypothetical protein